MEKQLNRTEPELKKTYDIVKIALQLNSKKFLVSKSWHSIYTYNSLIKIGPSIYGYDCGHPWLLYYIELILTMLNDKDHTLQQYQIKPKIITMLSLCKKGGFAGGDGQVAHLATTYAAFLAIILLGPQAYELLDKNQLYNFFKQRKNGGKFHMHENGESDLRGIYIVVIIAKLLKLNEDIFQGIAEEIISCQTYQGGLTNVKGGEAHGGYTFCGVAALAMINKLQKLDISRLMFWLSHRQVNQLGGFNGRTNKLIDSCYSFWVGAVFNIVNNYFKQKVQFENHLLYSQQALQQYLIQACQDPKGGFVDKPQKSRDLYHSAYAMAGLSLSQQYQNHFEFMGIHNKLKELDPIYNVTKDKLELIRQHFN